MSRLRSSIFRWWLMFIVSSSAISLIIISSIEGAPTPEKNKDNPAKKKADTGDGGGTGGGSELPREVSAPIMQVHSPPKRNKISHGTQQTNTGNLITNRALRISEMQVHIDNTRNVVLVSGKMVYAPEIQRRLVMWNFMPVVDNSRIYPMEGPADQLQTTMRAARGDAFTINSEGSAEKIRDYLISLYLDAIEMCSTPEKRGGLSDQAVLPGMIAVDQYRITATQDFVRIEGIYIQLNRFAQ